MKEHNEQSANRILLFFIFAWFILNVVQAAFTQIHPDEAYYWLYAQFLDWGYFDHPPMVALYIKAGDSLFHNPLGLRLVTVITNTLSIALLWQLVKPYGQNIKLFILLVSSILLFHVYGFITTPDSPLFFFALLFFYFFKKYQEEDKIKWALILALVISAMLYSKYHAVLVLFFTVISNLKILKRPSFWLVVACSVLLFVPHILWQIKNDYPSLKYHLIDRSSSTWAWWYPVDYFWSQVLLAGPLIGWFLYILAWQVKNNDAFIKTMRFNMYGIFAFFFVSTFKGHVEAHWTLLAYVPLLFLSYVSLNSKTEQPKWFKPLALTNIGLILLLHVILIVPILKDNSYVKPYFYEKDWAKAISEKAKDNYVVFSSGFQDASIYNFYNRTVKGFNYDTRAYRKTQFEGWPIEDSLRNKKVYYVRDSSLNTTYQDTIKTEKGIWYGTFLDSVRLYQKVEITPINMPQTVKSGQYFKATVKIHNPYQESISFKNTGEKYTCILESAYLQNGDIMSVNTIKSDFNSLQISAKADATIALNIIAPKIPGKYKLIFSIRTAAFKGSRNSNFIPLVVSN